MRLQVKQQLQSMFDFTKKSVGILEDAVFLIGQAADALEGGEAEQRVALTQLREIAAVEELQELDGEFDVADTASPGFNFPPPFSSAFDKAGRMGGAPIGFL